ncbi:MAG: class I SAM-dependent methyltransferase [Anaerolineales bacterium]|nr:class I SAM-dependent methyltransferase [Anaerolineales bacterium]
MKLDWIIRRARNAVASKGGWRAAVRFLFSHPRSVGGLLRDDQRQNWYYDIGNDDEAAAFAAQVTASDIDRARTFILELRNHQAFYTQLSERLLQTRFRPHGRLPVGRRLSWYAIIRLVQPEICVETGVHDGLGSAVILQALEDNFRLHGKAGQLISIDRPSSDLPADFPAQPGWLVPPTLRHRYDLRLGDARQLLPAIATEYSIGFFIHDSDHSPQHERFEIETVWPAMKPGGIVMTDNGPEVLRQFARQENTSFFTFREQVLKHTYPGASNSATVKPASAPNGLS